MSDVEVGVVLLGYVDRLSVVVSKLLDASSTAREASDLFAGEEGFYDGEARSELKLFYSSYAANVDRLIQINMMAVQYLKRVFDDFKLTDEELTSVITMWAESAVHSGAVGTSPVDGGVR